MPPLLMVRERAAASFAGTVGLPIMLATRHDEMTNPGRSQPPRKQSAHTAEASMQFQNCGAGETHQATTTGGGLCDQAHPHQPESHPTNCKQHPYRDRQTTLRTEDEAKNEESSAYALPR
jgi:hypothetical protein